MFCITLESKEPSFYLGLEEILLKEREEEYLILGINHPSIIIGKHQTVYKEINTRYITENNIPVYRRISGGGTVYHDEGNLNFTFIKNSISGKQIDFRKYTRPVIEFLGTLGIDAKLEGKNDLKVGSLKISGNAEHVYRNRVLHHGTLLFSSSLDILRESLSTNISHYISRSVDSNPSSVTNLKGLLNSEMDISDFRSRMMDYFLGNYPGSIIYKLQPSDIEEAVALSRSKYESWEWTWGYGPEYSFNNTFKINGKSYSCGIKVKDGYICECEIKGRPDIEEVARHLIGKRHMTDEVFRSFKECDIKILPDDVYKFF